MSMHLLDFYETVKTCPTKAAFFSIFEHTLSRYGVRNFSYGALSTRDGQVSIKTVDLYHVSYSAAVQRATGGLNRYSDDLTTFRASMDLDTFWTDQSLWRGATKAQVAQNNREIDAGVRVGVTHCLGQFGLKKASIGLDMSGMSPVEFQKDWPELSKFILPIAQVMHSHFTKDHATLHYKLSPRELDVLSWLAMGLRPDEIAERLGVGYRSVDKYIVTAKDKLGANSRDHAVARALTLGLLEL